MKKDHIYFVSDVHLDLNHPNERSLKRKNKFLDFLKKIENNAKELVFNGDIFDFYFEWHHSIAKYNFDILYQLKKMINSGIVIRYVKGNHDFYFESFMQKEIGILIYEELSITYNGKKFYLHHGDGVAKSDGGYRLLKRIIRNPISIFLFKTFISADLGIFIAKQISSPEHYRKKVAHDWEEEYTEYAKSILDQGYDYVLFGHLHCPHEAVFGEKKYINLGDWINHFSYAEFNGQELELKYF